MSRDSDLLALAAYLKDVLDGVRSDERDALQYACTELARILRAGTADGGPASGEEPDQPAVSVHEVVLLDDGHQAVVLTSREEGALLKVRTGERGVCHVRRSPTGWSYL